jgi:hypothetical protein
MNFRLKNSILFLALISIFSSCVKENTTNAGTYSGGFFISNEGAYGKGNASIDYYNYSKDSFYSNIFSKSNSIALGDVLQMLAIANNRIVAIINNSDKILFLNKTTLAIENSTSVPKPRFAFPINSTEILVSSMNGSMFVINTTSGAITKTIQTGFFTDKILKVNDKYYIEFQKMVVSSNNEQGYLIFDANLTQIEKFNTSFYPSGTLLIGTNLLATQLNDPNFTATSRITKIDLATKNLETIANGTYSPLMSFYNGELYFFADNAVKKMTASGTVTKLFDVSGVTSPYALNVIKSSGKIAICDATDYSSSGKIVIYNVNGSIYKTLNTGIAPNGILEN